MRIDKVTLKILFIFWAALLLAFTTFNVYADEQELTPAQWLEKGKAFQDGKDFVNAIAAYSRAIQLDSQFEQAYVERGKAYMYTKQNDLAVADFTKTIELDPQDAQLYWLCGLAYAGKGQHDLAINDYNQTLRINPQMYMAYWTSALSYEKMGLSYQAMQEYSNFVKNAPPDYPNVDKAKKRLNELADKDKARNESAGKPVIDITGLQKKFIFDFLKTDYLSLEFEKPRWVVGFQQSADNGLIIEFVTGNETVNNWTELVTVQFYRNPKQLSPAQYASFVEKHYRDSYGDKAQVNILRVSDADALVEYRVSGQPGIQDEHTITRILRGKASLMLVHYAAKPNMTAEKRTNGLSIIEGVQYFDHLPSNN